MDPLALLCNLYAEGPATLRVLHRAGLRSVEDVIGRDGSTLAELLDASPAEARRFAREAGRMARAGAAGCALETEEGGPILQG